MTDVLRKEIKYVVSQERFLMLKNTLDKVLERDRHGEGGRYMVRSQYYDSMWDQDLHDNLDGVAEKRKIRLRIYSIDTETVNLEYKCKSNTDGQKRGFLITRTEAKLMEQRSYDWLLKYENELALFLYAKMTQNVYIPKTIVEYQRLAYTNPISDVRITFDTNVRGSQYPYGLFEKIPQYVPLMKEDVGILEIKYNQFLPTPIRNIVDQIDRSAEASSKYSKARLLM